MTRFHLLTIASDLLTIASDGNFYLLLEKTTKQSFYFILDFFVLFGKPQVLLIDKTYAIGYAEPKNRPV